jgi:hypothetical protein
MTKREIVDTLGWIGIAFTLIGLVAAIGYDNYLVAWAMASMGGMFYSFQCHTLGKLIK